MMKCLQLIVTLTCIVVSGVCGQIPSKADDTEAIRAEAMKLIQSAEPTFRSVPMTGKVSSKESISKKAKYSFHETGFKAKDGQTIYARHFKLKGAKATVILTHGALSDSGSMVGNALLLRDAMKAEVFAIDLRGHGRSEGSPGDVSYIDQFSEDLATIVKKLRSEHKANKIILAGHSMGGGVNLRFAMRKDRPEVDGYVLFAPLLGQDTPTYPNPPSTGGLPVSHTEPFIKVHFQRIIGLKILNSIGENEFDGLPVLFFNPPANVRLRKYSHRANESMAPPSYKEGLKAVTSPLLVLVGSADEAFKATAFKDAIESNSDGKVILIDGATHNGVLEDRRAMDAIKNWFEANKNKN